MCQKGRPDKENIVKRTRQDGGSLEGRPTRRIASSRSAPRSIDPARGVAAIGPKAHIVIVSVSDCPYERRALRSATSMPECIGGLRADRFEPSLEMPLRYGIVIDGLRIAASA